MANDQSPSIGANDVGLTFTLFNVFGRNDPLILTGDLTEGLQEASFYYSVPLNARDLRFHIGGQISSADVVDDDVQDLDIESSAKQLTVGFAMPIIDTTSDRVGLDLSFNRERNRTYLLNEPFAFSPGTDEGRSDVSVLQFTQDWQNRGRRRAISAASTFNLGLPILGATDNGCCEEPWATSSTGSARASWRTGCSPTATSWSSAARRSSRPTRCWRASNIPWAASTPSAATSRTRWCATAASRSASSTATRCWTCGIASGSAAPTTCPSSWCRSSTMATGSTTRATPRT